MHGKPISSPLLLPGCGTLVEYAARVTGRSAILIPFHMMSGLVIAAGFLLLASAWRVLYVAQV